MKYIYFAVIFLFFSLNTVAQNLFKVVEINQADIYSSPVNYDTINKFFRIVLNTDTSWISATYPVVFPKGIDTGKAIAELLSYAGDIRLCVFPISCYNPAVSKIYLGKNKYYSLQIEALFIINQLVYKSPFNYASYPILVDKSTNKKYSIDGSIISKAFRAYKSWYKELRKKGINYVKEKDIMPLNGSTVRWY